MYESPSIEVGEIVKDLYVVLKQAIEMRVSDGAKHAKAIMFYSNATNGYVLVSLYDMALQDQVGTSRFYLELPKLWDLSMEHPDGAFFYDKMISTAVSNLFTKIKTGVNIKEHMQIYFNNELNEWYQV